MSHQFFSAYAKNRIHLRQYVDVVSGLKSLEPKILASDRDDIFICPLCLRSFNKSVLSNPEILIEEHVPPKKLGGVVRTITCHQCNHRAGTQLENDLKKCLESKDFDNRLISAFQNARLSFNGIEDLGGELRYVDGTLKFVGDIRRSNPKSLLKLQEVLKDKKQSLNITYKSHRIKRADIACIRIGYLMGFSIFGYGFLLNPNLDVIRKLIENPDKNLLPSFGVFEENFPDNMLGVNIVLYPKEIKSFLVVFDVISPKSKVITRYGVFLPGPSEPGLNIYTWLADREKLEFKHVPIGNQTIFESNPLYSYFLWQDPT